MPEKQKKQREWILKNYRNYSSLEDLMEAFNGKFETDKTPVFARRVLSDAMKGFIKKNRQTGTFKYNARQPAIRKNRRMPPEDGAAAERIRILTERTEELQKQIRQLNGDAIAQEKMFLKEKAETEELLDDLELDMRKQEEQIRKLREYTGWLDNQNRTLQAENNSLREKLESRDAVPVLLMGTEQDFYPGEIKDLVLDTLYSVVKNIPEKSRRADVLSDIVKHNNFQRLSISRADKIKKIFKNGDLVSGKTHRELKDLGLEITEDGKHYKVTYFGDPRYYTVYAKTPSDGRSGKNMAQNTINMAF